MLLLDDGSNLLPCLEPDFWHVQYFQCQHWGVPFPYVENEDSFVRSTGEDYEQCDTSNNVELIYCGTDIGDGVTNDEFEECEKFYAF